MKKYYRLFTVLSLVILGMVIMNTNTVKAAKGPDKSSESYAYIEVEKTDLGLDELGYPRYSTNYIYISQNMKDNLEKNEFSEYTTIIPEGLSYDEITNTLTMENYMGKELSCNMMGEDFKIVIKGENTLEMLYVWSGGYGGSLTIGGDGVLNICGGSYYEKDALYGECGIKIFSESSGIDDFLKITDKATVHVEGDGSYDFSLISVSLTSRKQDGIQLEGVKLAGGVLCSTKSGEEEYVKIDAGNGYVESYNKIKKGDTEYLTKKEYDFSGIDFKEFYVVYTNDLKKVESFESVEALENAGYRFELKEEYTYKIIGKRCTISNNVSSKKKKNDVFVKNNLLYVIRSRGTKKKEGTVFAIGVANPEKAGETLNIPKRVKVGGITYKVTGITGKTYKNAKVKKLVIGSYVKTIGESAFAFCDTIEKIVIRSKKLKESTIKKNAFKGMKDSIIVTVPSGKLSDYKKILLARGISLKATIKQ